MPRTLTAPPTDRGYWRSLLKLAHPDHHGTHDLFIWVQSLYEHVAGDVPEPPPRKAKEPPKHPPRETARVEYTAAYERFDSHAELTALIVANAEGHGEPFSAVLKLLEDLPEQPPDTAALRAQHVGCSYKQVALICHLAGLSSGDRWTFYRIAEALPLSQRHAGHLIGSLKAG